MNGHGTLNITGPVVINLAGVRQTNVLDIIGGSFTNNTYVPDKLAVNYAGHGNMTITGGSAAYAIINAPNASISFHGGSTFYGQAVGYTIDDQGLLGPGRECASREYDSFYEVSLRQLSD